MCQVYQKIVLIPRPDYASRYCEFYKALFKLRLIFDIIRPDKSHQISLSVLFKEVILRMGGRLSATLDLSSLAKISDGYTPGHIVSAVKHVLTERRVQQVNFPRPLSFSLITT